MAEATAVSRGATLAVLGSLYAAQGVVYGFAGFVLIPTLAAANVPLEAQTGLLALAGLPWVLKVLWGPVLDRFGARQGGRAATFVGVAMLGVAATLLWMSRGLSGGLAAVDIATVQTQWLLLSLLLSLQDVATDALALDRVREGDRGLANGVMLGGHHVGLEGIGGVVLGAAVVASGLSWALTLMAGIFAALAVAPAFLAPTRGVLPAQAASLLIAVRALGATRAARRTAILAAVVMFGDVVTSSVSGELWVHRLAWSPERVSAELPPVLLVANVTGYILAASIVDRIGHVRATAWGALALGSLWIAFAVAEVAWPSTTFLYAFVGAQALATALMFVGVHAMLMDVVVPAVRATHFALLMALLNLPRVVAPMVAPALLAALDFPRLFIACGTLQIVVGWAVSSSLRSDQERSSQRA